MNKNEKIFIYLDKVLSITPEQNIKDFYRRWLYFQLNQLSDEDFDKKLKDDFPETF